VAPWSGSLRFCEPIVIRLLTRHPIPVRVLTGPARGIRLMIGPRTALDLGSVRLGRHLDGATYEVEGIESYV
jgi:hypothetical protein